MRHPIICRLEIRVLAGEDEPKGRSTRGESVGNWR